MALADPAAHRVRYLLLPTAGTADAVRIARYGPHPSALPGTGVRTWSNNLGKAQWTLVAATGG